MLNIKHIINIPLYKQKNPLNTSWPYLFHSVSLKLMNKSGHVGFILQPSEKENWISGVWRGVFTRAHMYELSGRKKRWFKKLGNQRRGRHFNLCRLRSCYKWNWGISEMGPWPVPGYLYWTFWYAAHRRPWSALCGVTIQLLKARLRPRSSPVTGHSFSVPVCI